MEVMKASAIAIAIMLALLVCANVSEGQVLLDEPVARLGKGTIGDIAYSPDGRLFAVGGSAGIWLYDANSLAELGLLEGDTGEVTSIAFSPDGRMIASGGSDKSVRLWDVMGEMEIAVLEGHAEAVTSVAFSPDGGMLASGGVDRTIRLWSLEDKVMIAALEGHTAPVTSVAFSPDGRTLASAGEDKMIRLWSVEEKLEIATLEGHTAPVTSVAFSPDGKTLASGGEDSTVRLWDTDGQEEMAVLSHESRRVVRSVAFSPDGNTLAVAETYSYTGFNTYGLATVRLWDMESRSEMAEFPTFYRNSLWAWEHDKNSAWVAFSPDSNILASASDFADVYDSAVHFWDIIGQEEIATIEGYVGWAYPIGFSPDGKTLVLEDPADIRFWSVAAGKEIGVNKTEGLFIRAFSPDGKSLALLDGSFFGPREFGFYLSLWDVETGTEIASWPGGGGPGWFEGVVYEFSPDRNAIAYSVATFSIGYYYSTHLLDFAEEEMVNIPVEGVPIAFSPDGKTLVLSGDEWICLWDTEGRRGIDDAIAFLEIGLVNVAFSPDSRYLAAAGSQGDEWEQLLIHLWDLETREEIAVFEVEPGDYVELAFSPDGRIFASKIRVEDDWLIRMWNVETKEEIDFWDPSGFSWSPEIDMTKFPPFPWLSPEVEMTEFPAEWENIESSPDGGTLVLEGAEALSLWDVERKEMTVVLGDARGPVAFSSDGRLLASGSRSGIILIWDVSPWTGITPAVVESEGKKALVWGELKSAHGEDIVEQAKLWQNYPNPFNPETWIPFQLAKESDVILRIYDTKGSLIREMSLGKKPAGSYMQRSKAIHWDGRNGTGEQVASGIYFYTIQAGDFTATKKMIVGR